MYGDEPAKLQRMSEATFRLAVFLAVFSGIASWELAWPRRILLEPRGRRWPANIGLAVLDTILVRAVAGGALASVAALADARAVGVLHWASAPLWLSWAIAIPVLDFAVYLQHVAFHAAPTFWRFHRVHHADLGFDATTGIRFHPVEVLISFGWKAIVVLLLGAPVSAVIAFEILLNASSLFNHGNVAIPTSVDRWLRRIVVTPDMHRIHHSSRVEEMSSNFAFSFSLWDRLCGTYRSDPKLGQTGLEIGLSEFRAPLHLGALLWLPFRTRRPRSFDTAEARP